MTRQRKEGPDLHSGTPFAPPTDKRGRPPLRAPLFFLLLIPQLLAMACVPAGPEGPTTLRLLEGSTVTEVAWPEGIGEPPWPLSGAEIGALPAPGRVGRVPMASEEEGRDNRAALLAPTGSRYRFRLRLPEDPELRTGLGYRLPDEGPGDTVLFRVQATPADGPAMVILDERVPTRSDGVWRDLALPLDPWAGEEITLEFETSGTPGISPTWAAWSAPEVVSRSAQEEAWDVILIVLDTLRADRLGCYGYERATSPRLDTFASTGVRFATAVAQSPWTRPSHWALFTGLYPVSYGELQSPPLATALWRAGYRTLALTGGGQLDGRFGFARGFEVFRIQDWVQGVDGVLSWLAADEGRRRFLFLHTYEIHDPYTHTGLGEGLPRGRVQPGFGKEDWEHFRSNKLTPEEKAYVEALYDSGIAYTDDRLGLLFEKLEGMGTLERAILIVTSDHGEQFWEHYSWGHGQNMYDHQLLVPLFLHLPPGLRRTLEERGGAPGLGGRVIEEQVSLVDLYPTILDLLEVPFAHQVQGRSLRPLLEGGSLPPRHAFAENTNIERFERKALRTPRYKFVYSFAKTEGDDAEGFELYDLRRDAAEKINLAEELPELTASLQERLTAIIGAPDASRLQRPVPEEIDPDLRRQLEALGYVGH